MPLICLEGASAVGKTSTCKEIASRFNAYIVPEVNMLFQRKDQEPQKWYLERQAERWSIALDQMKSYDLVLLDGDVFQPIWYNWIYPNEHQQSWLFLKEFYSNLLKTQQVGFPEYYFHLSTSKHELRRRKETDKTRRRGNFEKHLHFIEPQKRYFQSMRNLIPDLVHFIEADQIEKNADTIVDVLSNASSSLSHRYSTDLFAAIMNQTKPNGSASHRKKK